MHEGFLKRKGTCNSRLEGCDKMKGITIIHKRGQKQVKHTYRREGLKTWKENTVTDTRGVKYYRKTWLYIRGVRKIQGKHDYRLEEYEKWKDIIIIEKRGMTNTKENTIIDERDVKTWKLGAKLGTHRSPDSKGGAFSKPFKTLLGLSTSLRRIRFSPPLTPT